MGIFEISFTGGIAIGALWGGYLWDYFSKPVNFLGLHIISPAFSLNGLIYLASLTIFFWGLKDIKGASNKRISVAHHLKALEAPGVWRFAPAWLAVNSIFGMWINHSTRLLTGNERFPGQLLTGNYGPKQFGVGMALFAVIFLVGIFAWSFSIARYRKTSVMLCGIAGMFATLGLVYGLNHLSSPSDSQFYPLMGAFAAGVLVMSGFAPAALVYLAGLTEAHSTDRGSIMGLYSVFLGVGQFLGTAIGGRFASWNGIDGLLLMSAILGVITTVTVLLLRGQESASFKPNSSAAVET
jgi:predicted MFS family arabinose efflux permease